MDRTLQDPARLPQVRALTAEEGRFREEGVRRILFSGSS